MATGLQVNTQAGEIERVLLDGDLSRLSETQRLSYYNSVCGSLGLNPLTKPFAYIRLNGKLVLYALKDATEQLRKIHGVSITSVTSQRMEDVFVVTASASDRTGRTDASTGAVAIGNLKGEALANALMKAETKAKRRATLSICGLGMLDETEAETIPQSLPPVVVEPPDIEAAKLEPVPDGAFRVVKAESRAFGGVVTLLDHDGVEDVYQVPETRDYQLIEQWAQEGPALICGVRVKSRDGVKKLKAITQYQTPEALALKAEIAEPDAKIAAQTPSTL
jgi:hypothetical protein